MSDAFEMLVDVDAKTVEAADLSRGVIGRFRKLGLITGRPNSDCVLDGKGYRPSPAVADLYKLPKGESPFWVDMVTNGVAPKVGRGFNGWALNVDEGLSCPSCGAKMESFGDAFSEALGQAMSEWLDQSGKALLKCPTCRKNRSLAEWHCKPPLGCGNLSFTFWNWPPLDSPSWKIDIPRIVREVTGHTIVLTYGRT